MTKTAINSLVIRDMPGVHQIRKVVPGRQTRSDERKEKTTKKQVPGYTEVIGIKSGKLTRSVNLDQKLKRRRWNKGWEKKKKGQVENDLVGKS